MEALDAIVKCREAGLTEVSDLIADLCQLNGILAVAEAKAWSLSDSIRVSEINKQRCTTWHSEGEEWIITDWTNAVCGEAGELANKAKKIRRLDTGTNARTGEQDREALVSAALDEIADVYLYLDLTRDFLAPNVPLLDIVASKFNRTSEEFGFTERL
jgi:hypothetical protein